MSTDNEWQRLQVLYAAMSDAEVLELFQREDDLTDVARETLATEFRRRGLVAAEPEPAYGDADAAAVAVRAAESDAGEAIHLWDFTDVTDATSSLSVLQRHDIPARLKPVSFPGERGRMDGNGAVAFQLYVAQADTERAVDLLRRHRGLFPLAEIQAFAPRHELNEDDFFVVGEFDSPSDAELAMAALTAQQIPFRKEEEARDGRTTTSLEVAQSDIERASTAMESAFQSSPEG